MSETRSQWETEVFNQARMAAHPPPETGPQGIDLVAPPGSPRPSAQPAAPSGPLAELEEQLRQAERMAAVGRLAAAVAHDFNNVIQAVMGYTSFALEELPEGSAARRDLEQVLTVSSRAATLVRQLLVLARREHSQPERVDVGEVVSDLSKLLRRAVGETVELVVSIDAPPHPVLVDRGQLEQALVTLVLGARETLTPGGRLELGVGHAETRTDDARGEQAAGPRYVELRVAAPPGGTGVPLRPAPGPEQRGDPAAGAATELSDAARFAERHGGFVSMATGPDRGTELRIYLPPASAAPVEPAAAVVPMPGAAPLRILLAEDDEQIRRLAQRALEKAGFTVLAAADGEEALALFDAQADEISVALIDVVMPKLGGTAVLSELRRRRPTLPVVLTSGYSLDPQGPDEGEHTVLLAKPYSPKAMVERIRALVTRAGGSAR